LCFFEILLFFAVILVTAYSTKRSLKFSVSSSKLLASKRSNKGKHAGHLISFV
jgi:hypothetical protein